jgi:hypothetical protein
MLLLVDQDERPFVNYLSLLLDDLDDPLVALAEHRDVVVCELDALTTTAVAGRSKSNGLLIDIAKSDRRFGAFAE